MNALKYGFGLILVGGFALTASCGGSSGDDSSTSTGGTTSSTGGTVGTPGGGTVGNPGGGTVGNPSGGTVGNPGGGTVGNPSGGTGNPAGGTGNPAGGNPAGGNGAGGGATMNPAACPATAPAIPAMGMPGEACMALPRGTACNYVMGDMTETCTCRIQGGGGPGGGQAGAANMDGTFRCQVGATPIMCAAVPKTGDACTGLGCLPAGGNVRNFCRCQMGMLTCPTGMGAAGAGG